MKDDIKREAAEIARALQRVPWRWAAGEVATALAPLAPEFVEEVPGRTTFTIPGGHDLSIYSEGDAVSFVEITLDSFEDSHLLSEWEYEDKVDEFFRKYEQAVEGTRSVLGKPVFDDGAGNTKFPDDQEAVWLALWPADNGRFMIQQKHEDKELPFRVTVVIAPPAA